VDAQEVAEYAVEEQSYEEQASGDAGTGERAAAEPPHIDDFGDEPSAAADAVVADDTEDLSVDESGQEHRESSGVGGSIDALFSGAETSHADEEAATRLAD